MAMSDQVTAVEGGSQNGVVAVSNNGIFSVSFRAVGMTAEPGTMELTQTQLATVKAQGQKS